VLDFIRSLTLPHAEAVGELVAQARTWLMLGFAVLGVTLKPAVQADPKPANRPFRRPGSIAARLAPIVVIPVSADAEPALAHMTRVCEVVNASLSSADRIVTRHAAAAVRLDAAEYALHCLVEELKAVMTPPIALAASAARPMPKRPQLPTDLPALAA
jgi:hypothetical protein